MSLSLIDTPPRAAAPSRDAVLEAMADMLFVVNTLGEVVDVPAFEAARHFCGSWRCQGGAHCPVPIWDVLYGARSAAGAAFAQGFASVVEGRVPLALALSDLPTRLDRGAHQYAVAYHPLLQNGVLSFVVITLHDRTRRPSAVPKQASPLGSFP